MSCFRVPALLSCAVVSFSLVFGSAAAAAVVSKIEPNSTPGTAQSLNAHFSLDFDANIGDMIQNTSTKYKHATVKDVQGNDTFDYYSVDVAAGVDKLIFDIDDTSSTASVQPYDVKIFLYYYNGPTLQFKGDNDNSTSTSHGAGGSTSLTDPYMEYNVTQPGKYVIGVARKDSIALADGIGGSPIKRNDVYTIHVTQVPEPATAALAGLGALSIIAYRIRRNQVFAR